MHKHLVQARRVIKQLVTAVILTFVWSYPQSAVTVLREILVRVRESVRRYLNA